PDGNIPNCTGEDYIGSRKNIHEGPCLIGHLVDVQAFNTGTSVINDVESCTVAQLRMNAYVPPGLKFKVKHFRILSHYEMQALVNLQRIRRRIVDSVYLRLNGEKRKVGKNAENRVAC